MTISTNISVGLTSETSSVQAYGTIVRTVTEQDRVAFGITDANLKRAVGAYKGKTPNDVYLYDPTSWGNKYKEYGWEEVTTTLVVDSARILGVSTQTDIVKNTEFRNESSKQVEFNTGISTQVSNTSEHSWTNSNTLKFEQKFQYQIGFLGTGGGGETTLSYERSWGETTTESKTITLGSESGAKVLLDPGEGVDVFLYAERGVLNVRIEYKAYLKGQVFANYNPTFEGHHFYGPYIDSVMRAGGLTNSQRITQDIQVGFYANDRIVVRDPVNDKIKRQYSVNEIAFQELQTVG